MRSDKKETKESITDPVLLENLVDTSIAVFESALKRAFELRKDLFVFELMRRANFLRSTASSEPVEGAHEEKAWIKVESLSRLRGVVGGRFDNIKKKWVGAGFPLREHRGDKAHEFKVDEKGWIELSNWVLKHGYEARLTPQSTESLFELRSIEK